MATKKLKTASITLIGCGDSVVLTAIDTATEPNAKYALDAFNEKNMMHFKSREVNGEFEYYVPFHAVDNIMVTESEAKVADKPNPYGC